MDKDQATAIAYNCVTCESSFYFEMVAQHILSLSKLAQREMSRLSAIKLGVWFHDQIWKYRRENRGVSPYQKHQPHNGKEPPAVAVKESLLNLLTVVHAFNNLEPCEAKKQYYHSKALAKIERGWNSGGCYAWGSLTSQSLLSVLSSLGLIPVACSRWAEVAISCRTATRLQDEGVEPTVHGTQQFLGMLASSLGGPISYGEHSYCKFVRDEKGRLVVYRDVLYKDQAVYIPTEDEVMVITSTSKKRRKPPAHDWPDGRPHCVSADFWEERISGRPAIAGGRRTKKTGANTRAMIQKK